MAMHRAIASSGYLGFIPRRLWGSDAGAGTFGAALAAGIGLVILATGAPWWVTAVAAAAATVLSLWSATPFSAGGEDPGWVCMDETAGTLLALIGLGGWPWVVALVVARLADIFKVLPGVRAAEGLHGAVGITADDLVAGLYGLGAGWALTALLG
jgi:phosphatidylglycerophosphatase A